MKDCTPWEGFHPAAEKEWEDKEAADKKHLELTLTLILHFPVPLGERR